MSVPDFQTLMLPMVRLAADGHERAMGTAIQALADQFGLTPEQRAEQIPSGRQPLFYNRVAWAGTYLRKAGLLETAGRGRFRITQRGRQVLATNPTRIDIGSLDQYPEFREFRKNASSSWFSTCW